LECRLNNKRSIRLGKKVNDRKSKAEAKISGKRIYPLSEMWSTPGGLSKI
jgi:hypothetical protein